MGLFGGIKDAYKKTEAALVIQNLLEHQGRIGFFEGDPAALSQRLVSSAWDQKPDMFGGKFGQRPHKLSVAAISIAVGVGDFEKYDRNRAVLLLALGNILSELEVNGRLYPLNGIDSTLIDGAAMVFADPAEQYVPSFERDMFASDTTTAVPRETPVNSSCDELSPSDAKQMKEFGITVDGERYCYGDYKYDRLLDAISHAKLQKARSSK